MSLDSCVKKVSAGRTIYSTELIRLCKQFADIEVQMRTCNLREEWHQLKNRRKGVYNMIDGLLNEGVDVDAVDWTGKTALHYCCKHRSTAVLQRLLNQGAATSASGRVSFWKQFPMPVLCHALFDVNRGAVESMLLHGADPEWKVTTGGFYMIACHVPSEYHLFLCGLEEIGCLTFLLLTVFNRRSNEVDCFADDCWSRPTVLDEATGCMLALRSMGARPSEEFMTILKTVGSEPNDTLSNTSVKTFCRTVLHYFNQPLSLFEMCRSVVVKNGGPAAITNMLPSNVARLALAFPVQEELLNCL